MVLLLPFRQFGTGNPELLLAEQKTGPFKGLLMSPGGKLQHVHTGWENPLSACIREAKEELQLTPKRGFIHLRAKLYVHYQSDVQFLASVYDCWNFDSAPQETNVMGKPRWYDTTNLPYNNMPPADRYWLPTVLFGAHKTIPVIRLNMGSGPGEFISCSISELKPGAP